MDTLQNKVSVIIPNYNYARYIKRRIRSVVAQTYPIYELIILDDKSSDKSDEIICRELTRIRQEYPNIKIKYIKNEKNSGKSIRQWRLGFKEAKGDFVWIAEADDLSNKHFLEEAMRGFKNNVIISYTESAIINGFGIPIAPNFRWSRDKEKTGHFKHDYILDGITEIKNIMAIRCTIPNVSAAVFRIKNIPYDAILAKSEEFSQVGDWYFYLKLLEYGKISYNKKSLNYFRIHEGSVTSDSKKASKHYEEVKKIHKILMRKYDLSNNIKISIEKEEKRLSNKFRAT